MKTDAPRGDELPVTFTDFMLPRLCIAVIESAMFLSAAESQGRELFCGK